MSQISVLSAVLRPWILGASWAWLCLHAVAQAQPGGPAGNSGPGQSMRHHGPPAQAIAACKGKAVDAACSFIGHQGEKLNGTCFMPPAGHIPVQGGMPPQAGAQSGPPNGGPGTSSKPAQTQAQRPPAGPSSTAPMAAAGASAARGSMPMACRPLGHRPGMEHGGMGGPGAGAGKPNQPPQR